MIGDEIIFGRIRSKLGTSAHIGSNVIDEDKPHQPSRPPWHVTSHRLAFRPITIKPKDQAATAGSETVPLEGNKKETGTNGQARPAKNGLVTVTSAMTSALPPTKKASEVSRASSEAGPSRQSPEKGQAAQTQQGGETPAPSAKPRKESALHLRELTKLDEVMAITTIKIASTTRCEFCFYLITDTCRAHPSNGRADVTVRLSKELTDRFSIQTTPEHAISVQTTGYSQKDLLNMIQGKPLRGKGSRIPRGGKHDEASDGNLESEGDDGESAKMGSSKGKAARGSGARGRATRGRGGGRGRGRSRGGKADKGVAREAVAEGEEDDRDDSSDGDVEV